jgi:uroporphyrin-3 C-methyltransferase
LQEVADPSLLPVRRAIAADIQAIQQVNPVAVNSVALSLSGIISTVDTLPLNALQLPEAESGEPEAVSENIADWQENLARVWHSLMDDFVTVRRREAAVEPMMSDAQTFLAQEQLKLSLMQAQQAALGHEATLYQEALKTSTAIIATHFDLQDPQITQLLGAISNLQSTNIQRVLPPSLQSHQILQDTMARRTRRSVNTGNEI